MPDILAKTRHDLALANRILAHEGVIDAFGHVSVRHPHDPERYLISRHQASELVQPEDILEFTLDSVPVTPTSVRFYGELVIHGCIYQARPDVQAICHHHSPSVLPYCITGMDLVPVYHLGGSSGAKVPLWDSRDEFGDTALVVIKPEEGRSLARALGSHWMVLLARHGATVVGESIMDMTFRTIYSTRNAELQARAQMLGPIGPLSAGEAEKCFTFHQQPRPTERAWEYWTMRLQKAEALYAMAMRAMSNETGVASVAARRKKAVRKPAVRKRSPKPGRRGKSR